MQPGGQKLDGALTTDRRLQHVRAGFLGYLYRRLTYVSDKALQLMEKLQTISRSRYVIGLNKGVPAVQNVAFGCADVDDARKIRGRVAGRHFA